MKIIFFVFLVLLQLGIVCSVSYCQGDTAKKVLPIIITEDKDTIAVYQMEEVVYTEKIDYAAVAEQKKWSKLIRDVQKTMPFADTLALMLKEIDADLASLPNEKARRKYMNTTLDELSAKYTEILKNLTYDQGKLLIKLVDRQTGKTTYDLIKEYRSGIIARFWQTTGSVVGLDLKEAYNPEQDAQIEQVIQYIWRGTK